MFIIITKSMMKEIRNKDIYQFFGDATYRCVPPSFRSYRLYVISGFNMIIKRTRILSYALIQNETEKTFNVLFSNLKNKFGFNPKLFNIDFNKASCKAIKKVFPNIYIVKCFFHFNQCLYKKLKQLGLTKKLFKDDILEILFNLKRLAFIDPKDIPNLYKKIKTKYNKKEYSDFYAYFEKTWKPMCKFKNHQIIPDWNYYYILNSFEIDIKYLFLSNNVSEHINKILNSNFNTKFPSYDKWRTALLKTEKDINKKTEFLERYDYISQIMIFFIKYYKNNKTNKNLLLKEDIKKLTSFIRPDSSIGNIVGLSNFFLSFTYNEIIENDNGDNDEEMSEKIMEDKDSNSSSNSSDSDEQECEEQENSHDNLIANVSDDDNLSNNLIQVINHIKIDLD